MKNTTGKGLEEEPEANSDRQSPQRLLPALFFGQNEWFFLLLLGLLILIFLIVRYAIRKKTAFHQQKLRRKLARDFHDELGSRLSIISMYSELAKMQLKKGDLEIEKHLDKIRHTAGSVYDAMKDLLWTLDPGQDTIDSFALKTGEMAEEMLKPVQVEFAMHKAYPNKNCLLSMDQKRHLLLIIKEALNNAVKYAGCSRIELEIKTTDRELTLKLSDNGKGFDQNEVTKGEGLKNMRSRADELGGVFSLASDPQGTTVEIQCLLHQQNW